jgi:membrane protein YqaA with SNARE-associated domain
MAYLTLFLTAFAAATLLPGGSEALYIYHLQNGYNALGMWLAASTGNTLGSGVNYWLGCKGELFLERKGYVDARRMHTAKRHFARYGGWVLLLSWMPVIGDPLTFVAGVLRYDATRFFMIVFIAKAVRYAAIGFLWHSVSV